MSRGLGDVYKRQVRDWLVATGSKGLLEAWGAALPAATPLAETAG